MKILFFTFVIVTGIAQRAIAQISLQEEFDKLLMPQFKANEPGGVVMVAQNGVVIYKKAFGMANLELNVPTNDSMIFNIGSNTKQFTSVAILQLVEKGKLNLQDSLENLSHSHLLPSIALLYSNCYPKPLALMKKTKSILKHLSPVISQKI